MRTSGGSARWCRPRTATPGRSSSTAETVLRETLHQGCSGRWGTKSSSSTATWTAISPTTTPTPACRRTLRDLIASVRENEADLGLAFDGDADRLGVVDGDGTIIWPDRQMMLFAQDVLAGNPGAEIVFDVKCSSLLPALIERLGGPARHVEDRPLLHQEPAPADRRTARGRDERTRLLRGSLVRLRRRASMPRPASSGS